MSAIDKKNQQIVENAEYWKRYRLKAASIQSDGLEVAFPHKLRQSIHKMAVCNLSGVLCALEDAFFDDEMRESPPDEMDRVAVVIDCLRQALDAGTIEEFADYVRVYEPEK
jgi:hypothetical protein